MELFSQEPSKKPNLNGSGADPELLCEKKDTVLPPPTSSGVTICICYSVHSQFPILCRYTVPVSAGESESTRYKNAQGLLVDLQSHFDSLPAHRYN